MSNLYYWEKLTFSKLVEKEHFVERKFEEMHQLWRAKRYKLYSGKRLFWHYCLQLSFVYKTMSQISFNLFCSGDKKFYQSSLGNKVDLKDIKNVFRNIFAKNWNSKKLKHGFVDERAMMTYKINKFLSLEKPCNFLLAKEKAWKRIVSTDSELS